MKSPIKQPVTRERFQEVIEWLNYNGPVSTPGLDTLPSETDKKHQKIVSIGS